MIHLKNQLTAVPEANLTPAIRATQILPPIGGQMSSHKIWIPPGEAYPPHTHPSPHVILILEGGGHGDIGGEKCLLTTGDVFFVPGNVRHLVGADSRGMIMLAVSVGSLELTDPGRLVLVD